jgi:hypothetical protein
MISGEGFAWIARVHGHLALLSVVLLAHPVVTMRGPNVRRWTQITAELAAALTVTVWSLGAWLYPTWRREVKPPWVLAGHDVVPAFEVKEHLAAVAAALAVAGGGGAARRGPRGAGDEPGVAGAGAVVVGDHRGVGDRGGGSAASGLLSCSKLR